MNQPGTLTNHWLNSSLVSETKKSKIPNEPICVFCRVLPTFVDLAGCIFFPTFFLEFDQEVMSLEAEAPPPKKSFGSPSEAFGRCGWSWWDKCSSVSWEIDLGQQKKGTKYDPGFCFIHFDQMKWNVQTSTSIIFSDFDEWWICTCSFKLTKVGRIRFNSSESTRQSRIKKYLKDTPS